MKTLYLNILLIFCALAYCACDDGDSFTTSPNNLLTFSTDTLKLDTVFSTIPSSTRTFWAYNKSGDGLRNIGVRLEGGNQSGFRVNVDGVYLSPENGYKANDIEVRNKDSVRIYVELTSALANSNMPKRLSDNLIFTLESGRQQKVPLDAWTWDARIVRNCTISNDSTISAVDKPLVVYGMMKVSEGATLTIAPGSTIFFHNDAGLDVEGSLLCKGTSTEPIVLRGDRLDRMFDYLPYDRVSGQWQGVRFGKESFDNVIDYTDIHSSFNGVQVDSSGVDRLSLAISNSTIHNCQGYALRIIDSKVTIENCQLSNALYNCLDVEGGDVVVNNSTIAQFYPFDGMRAAALNFSALTYPLVSFKCSNSIITGYANDEMMGGKPQDSDANEFNYEFNNCIIRTPEVGDDSEEQDYFVDCVFEDVKDTVSYGIKLFVLVDGDMQKYDFHLRKESAAIDCANAATSAKTDHDGILRDEKPDMGAYEYVKKEE